MPVNDVCTMYDVRCTCGTTTHINDKYSPCVHINTQSEYSFDVNIPYTLLFVIIYMHEQFQANKLQKKKKITHESKRCHQVRSEND